MAKGLISPAACQSRSQILPSAGFVSSHPNGFTLLELLVALVILGLCLAVLTSSISDSLARAERIETANHAESLADSILLQLGRDAPVVAGVTKGEVQNLFWRLIAGPAPGFLGNMRVDEIDLTITTASHRVVGQWRTLRLAPP